MFNSSGIELQRFRFWQGQKLRSADFRAQLSAEAELRWWHNRALHSSFGVRSGFTVIDSTIARAGDPEKIHIGCGVAYDCYGRELLLQSETEIALPQIGTQIVRKATLVARYKQTARQCSEPVTGCGCSLEAADFVWITASRIDPSDGVPIARLSYESNSELKSLPADVVFPDSVAGRIRFDADRGRLLFVGVMSEESRTELRALSPDISYQKAVDDLFEASQQIPKLDTGFVRPVSRPFARPKVGSSATPEGETEWEPWIENVSVAGQRFTPVPVGMQVTVDTSAAGFTETPCYFAWLSGTLWDRSNVEFFPAPFTHIDRERSDQFRFRVWLPPIVTVLGSRVRVANRDFPAEFINYARDHGLHVCWVGIQEGLAVDQRCADAAADECETAP
jgi:hypothetical protein